uniref:Uncharacterized protein n=1 Tax=Compsopogon caeruleus TaxID=31354 RepID=A0A7S1TJY1_9RHOD
MDEGEVISGQEQEGVEHNDEMIRDRIEEDGMTTRTLKDPSGNERRVHERDSGGGTVSLEGEKRRGSERSGEGEVNGQTTVAVVENQANHANGGTSSPLPEANYGVGEGTSNALSKNSTTKKRKKRSGFTSLDIDHGQNESAVEKRQPQLSRTYPNTSTKRIRERGPVPDTISLDPSAQCSTENSKLTPRSPSKSQVSDEPSNSASHWSVEFAIPDIPLTFSSARRSSRNTSTVERFDPSAINEDERVRQFTRKRLAQIGPLSLSSLVKEKIANEKVKADLKQQRDRMLDFEMNQDADSGDELIDKVRNLVEEEDTARSRRITQLGSPEHLFTASSKVEKTDDIFSSFPVFVSKPSEHHPLVQCLLIVTSTKNVPAQESLPSPRQLGKLCNRSSCPEVVTEWLFLLSTSLPTSQDLEEVARWGFVSYLYLMENGMCRSKISVVDILKSLEAMGANPDPLQGVEDGQEPRQTPERREIVDNLPIWPLKRLLKLAEVNVSCSDWCPQDLRKLWGLCIRICISPVGSRVVGFEATSLLNGMLESVPSERWTEVENQLALDTVSVSGKIRWQAEIVSRVIPFSSRGDMIRRQVSLMLLHRWHQGPIENSSDFPSTTGLSPHGYLIMALQLIKHLPRIDHDVNFVWLRCVLHFIKTFVDDEILGSDPDGTATMQTHLAEFKSGLSRFVNPEALLAKTDFLHMLRLSDVISGVRPHFCSPRQLQLNDSC